MSVNRPAASGSPVQSGCMTSRLARASASRFCVCIAMLLMRKTGRPASSSAYGMTDANGWPGCRRESVASVPVRPRYASVRARSAKVGSGTAGASSARGGPAWRLMDVTVARPRLTRTRVRPTLPNHAARSRRWSRHAAGDGGRRRPPRRIQRRRVACSGRPRSCAMDGRLDARPHQRPPSDLSCRQRAGRRGYAGEVDRLVDGAAAAHLGLRRGPRVRRAAGDRRHARGVPRSRPRARDVRRRPRLERGARPATDADAPFLAATSAHGGRRYLVTAPRDAAAWRYVVSGRSAGSAVCDEVRIVESETGEPAGYLEHVSRLWGTGLHVRELEVAPGVSWRAVAYPVLAYLCETGEAYARAAKSELGLLDFWLLGSAHP